MTAFRHALRQLRKHPGRYLPLYAQLAVSIFLFSFLIMQLLSSSDFQNKLSQAVENRNFYAVEDHSEIVTLMNSLSEEGAEQKCKELFQMIEERTSAYIHLEMPAEWNGIPVSTIQINQSFANLYSLDVRDGRMFTDAEYRTGLTREGAIPVVIGPGLQKKYPIGTEMTETFRSEDGRDETVYHYQIIGVLKKGSFYLEPLVKTRVQYLDEAILLPWVPDPIRNLGYANVNLVHVLQIEAENSDALSEIARKSRDLGLFDLDFASEQEIMAAIQNYYGTVYRRDRMILIALLLYCVTGSVTMLLKYMETHIHYFAINMLCGAGAFDAVLEMTAQIAIPILLGIVLGTVVFRKLFVMFLSAVFGAGLLLVIMTVPALTWQRLQIGQIFRRYE